MSSISAQVFFVMPITVLNSIT